MYAAAESNDAVALSSLIDNVMALLGKSSPVAGAKVQTQLQAGLKAGRWRTAGQVAAWLKEAHGIERAAKSLDYWLGKMGGALRVPRPGDACLPARIHLLPLPPYSPELNPVEGL